jgi:hypothetical protein
MNEQELLAKIGRQQIDHEKLDYQYGQLLSLLAGVVSGEIARSRVLVNLTDRTWLFTNPGESPPLPATINGLPVVIVAPPEPCEIPAPVAAE